MEATALQHFKDFLQTYNKMTENCFHHCALLHTERGTSPTEMRCLDQCAQKHIHVNHKIMKLFMDIQPELQKKKIEEAKRQLDALENEGSTKTAH